MIAYNHYIKFIPELKNDKRMIGAYSDVITVRESLLTSLPKNLSYELSYINNQGRDLKFYSDRKFSKTQKGQFWAFEVKGVVTFFWHSGTLTLDYLPDRQFTLKLLEYWCLHIVLPMFFTIEEKYHFLHTGAVEIEGKPILFIAESFGGKSTMTDYFMRKGHIVITDDKAATYNEGGQYFITPSHPHHRPYREKEDLGFFLKKFSTQPKPIHIAYEFEKVEADKSIEFRSLKGMEKFKSLRYASEMNLFFQKEERFEYLMKMANEIQIFKLSIPWDLNRLDEVYEAIVKHTQSIK